MKALHHDGGALIGMHFFNPVPTEKLVECRAYRRDRFRCLSGGRSLLSHLARPVRTTDSTDHVNGPLIPYLDAIRAYENGIGSIVDIDNGMAGCTTWVP
jgi:3-hydroxyacyl-CoA dehydrogenase